MTPGLEFLPGLVLGMRSWANHKLLEPLLRSRDDDVDDDKNNKSEHFYCDYSV